MTNLEIKDQAIIEQFNNELLKEPKVSFWISILMLFLSILNVKELVEKFRNKNMGQLIGSLNTDDPKLIGLLMPILDIDKNQKIGKIILHFTANTILPITAYLEPNTLFSTYMGITKDNRDEMPEEIYSLCKEIEICWRSLYEDIDATTLAFNLYQTTFGNLKALQDVYNNEGNEED